MNGLIEACKGIDPGLAWAATAKSGASARPGGADAPPQAMIDALFTVAPDTGT
jgi:hypothetical protein